VLESSRQASVDRDSVVATGEGAETQIVLVPHRQLGGFCLVVWEIAQGAEMWWARVADLSTHDQLDLGIRVRSTDIAGLHDNLLEELERPITLMARRRWLGRGLYCAITVAGKVHTTHITQAPAAFTGPEETSLASSKPVSVSVAVPIENWRRWV